MSVYRALVLQGGAAKGAFQIGALDELLKLNPELQFDTVVAASVGSLNGSQVASAPKNDPRIGTQKALKIWNAIAKEGSDAVYTPDLFEITNSWWRKTKLWLRRARPALFEARLLEPDGLKKMLGEVLDPETLFAEDRPDLWVNSMVLGNLETAYFSKSVMKSIWDNGHSMDTLIDIFMAATAVPVVFPPVSLDLGNMPEQFFLDNKHLNRHRDSPDYDSSNVMFIDGAVRDNAPTEFACKIFKDLVEAGSQYDKAEIYIMLCSDPNADNREWRQEPKYGQPLGVHVTTRAFYAVLDEIADQDLKNCQRPKHPWPGNIELKVYRPQRDLAGDLLTFTAKDIDANIEYGREIARKGGEGMHCDCEGVS